jgi:hypothetical protein
MKAKNISGICDKYGKKHKIERKDRMEVYT